MKDWDHTWYRPGNWSLPGWWTSGPPVRGGRVATHAEQIEFFDSNFARNVLGHTGGITTPPKEISNA